MYNKTVLANGVRIVTEALPHCQSVSLGLWLNTGSRDETAAENGMAHFLEHMAFKGTPRRSTQDLARQFDQLGGASNAFTTKENTCFHGRVLAKQLPRLVDLLADIVLNPLYDPEELAKEQEVVVQEILNHEDTPDDYVHTLFGASFWSDQPFGRSIMGREDTVRGLTRDALLRHRAAAYRPERLVVSACGNLRHDALVDLIAGYCGDFADGAPPRPRRAVTTQCQELFYERDLEQVHVCWGAPAPAAGDPDRFAAIVLNLILGGNMSSRLFQEVRENRGLCYSIYSYLNCYSDTGILGLGAAVSPAHLPALIEALEQELTRLEQTEVPLLELTAAQEYLNDSLLLGAEDTDNRMLRLAKNEINFGHYIPLEEIIDHLLAVTPDHLHALAQTLLPLSRWHQVYLGPTPK